MTREPKKNNNEKRTKQIMINEKLTSVFEQIVAQGRRRSAPATGGGGSLITQEQKWRLQI